MSKEKIYKNFPGGLKINDEYAKFVPPISTAHYNQLFVNIATDGYIRDPLTIDQHGDILDGHARYSIAEALDMSFKTVVKKVDSIKDAKFWIIRNTMGKRGGV